jgi:hypothetical protein
MPLPLHQRVSAHFLPSLDESVTSRASIDVRLASEHMFAVLLKAPMHCLSRARARALKGHWLKAWVVGMTLFPVAPVICFMSSATRRLPIDRCTFGACGALWRSSGFAARHSVHNGHILSICGVPFEFDRHLSCDAKEPHDVRNGRFAVR